MTLAIIFSVALSAATTIPCERAQLTDIVALIGGPAIPVPSEEMGEETAPGCMWSTLHREREVKLTVWSKDELPVLGLLDTKAYYVKLQADASSHGPIEELKALGDSAFLTGFKGKPGSTTDGLIVVLKSDRLFVFDFNRTSLGTEREFVTKLMK